MSVESVITVETMPGTQAGGELRLKCATPLMETEAAIALGVLAVKKQAKVRAARVKEVRARLATGTYRTDSQALAQKMLEIE